MAGKHKRPTRKQRRGTTVLIGDRVKLRRGWVGEIVGWDMRGDQVQYVVIQRRR